MTNYEQLKRKAEILRGAAIKCSDPAMASLWLAKANEIQAKINRMSIGKAAEEVRTK